MYPGGNQVVAQAVKNPKVASSVNIGQKPLNLVLIGQKIVSKDMDDGYVERCGNACAKKLNVTGEKVSTGLEFILALERATLKEELSACVFWGHSWAVGLYLQSGQGLYLDEKYDYYAEYNGARKLKDLKLSSMRTKPHSLFIFASCGTATDSNLKLSGYNDNSFASKFGNYIDKINSGSVNEGESFYKVTTIGATALSNLLLDGMVRTDGTFVKTVTLFKVEKKAVYKEVVEGWIFKEKKKVFDKWSITKTTVKSEVTILGKKIDPAEFIKNHNSNDTSI